MIVGFGIGLFAWFKATALLPVLSGVASTGRWIFSALLLVSLPWWMDYMPKTLSRVSGEMAGIMSDMFDDIGRMDRLVASEPEETTLAKGERLTWRLADSAYAETFGRMRLAAPEPPPANEKAAFAALKESIAAQVRALDDAQRAELFTRLDRDKRRDLVAAVEAFRPAASESANDPAASAATRRAAQRFLD
jgi:hypothetical protein